MTQVDVLTIIFSQIEELQRQVSALQKNPLALSVSDQALFDKLAFGKSNIIAKDIPHFIHLLKEEAQTHQEKLYVVETNIEKQKYVHSMLEEKFNSLIKDHSQLIMDKRNIERTLSTELGNKEAMVVELKRMAQENQTMKSVIVKLEDDLKESDEKAKNLRPITRFFSEFIERNTRFLHEVDIRDFKKELDNLRQLGMSRESFVPLAKSSQSREDHPPNPKRSRHQ